MKDWSILSALVRETDMAFPLGETASVLMGETSQEGAVTAIERFRSELDDGVLDLRFSSATFPVDAQWPAALLNVSLDRLSHARQGEAWAIWAGQDAEERSPTGHSATLGEEDA